MNNEIENSLNQIADIGDKVDTLNDSKRVIMGAVSELSAISEENAASNQEVSASVHEISLAVGDITTNASETKTGAADLKQTIDYFS